MIAPAIEAARLAERAYRESTWRWDNGVEVLAGGWVAGRQAVAFRGTEIGSIEDWVRDLRALPWWDRNLGWCHAGFLKGVREIWPRLARSLAAAGPLVFVGHSKGAAEAALASGLAVKAGLRVERLYLFGSPRPAFSGLGRILDGAGVYCQRFVRGDDCVPDHPWPIWGYRHVGPETWLPGLGERIGDHDMAGYRQAIEGDARIQIDASG